MSFIKWIWKQIYAKRIFSNYVSNQLEHVSFYQNLPKTYKQPFQYEWLKFAMECSNKVKKKVIVETSIKSRLVLFHSHATCWIRLTIEPIWIWITCKVHLRIQSDAAWCILKRAITTSKSLKSISNHEGPLAIMSIWHQNSINYIDNRSFKIYVTPREDSC